MTLNGQWAHFSPAHWFRTICTIPHNLLIFPKFFFISTEFFWAAPQSAIIPPNTPPSKSAPEFSFTPARPRTRTNTTSGKNPNKNKKNSRPERTAVKRLGRSGPDDWRQSRTAPGGKTDAQIAASTVVAPSDGHYKNILKNCFLYFLKKLF